MIHYDTPPNVDLMKTGFLLLDKLTQYVLVIVRTPLLILHPDFLQQGFGSNVTSRETTVLGLQYILGGGG